MHSLAASLRLHCDAGQRRCSLPLRRGPLPLFYAASSFSSFCPQLKLQQQPPSSERRRLSLLSDTQTFHSFHCLTSRSLSLSLHCSPDRFKAFVSHQQLSVDAPQSAKRYNPSCNTSASSRSSRAWWPPPTPRPSLATMVHQQVIRTPPGAPFLPLQRLLPPAMVHQEDMVAGLRRAGAPRPLQSPPLLLLPPPLRPQAPRSPALPPRR